MFLVMRGPSTMEDEGRWLYCGRFPTKRAAKDYIKEEVKVSKDYFNKSSFTIFVPLEK